MPAENRPQERRMLESRAMAALEGGELTRSSSRRTRLWEYPAFADFTSWIVQDWGAAALHSETLTVYQIVWNRARDLLGFADPLEGVKQGFGAPPTISTITRTIEADNLSPMLQDLATVGIRTAMIHEAVVLDGVEMGIHIEGANISIRATWRNEGPPEWETFTAAVGRCRELFRGLFQ